MTVVKRARARLMKRARHGGRRKRFDTVFERFWYSSGQKAALVQWGRSQSVQLDYSSIMRAVVEDFVRSHELPVPQPEEALTILSAEQNA